MAGVNVKYCLLLLCILIVASVEVDAQEWTLGLGLGIQRRTASGVNLIADSMRLDASQGGADRTTFTLYGKWQASKKIQFQSAISVSERIEGWGVADVKTQCRFCPVEKGYDIGSLAFDLETTGGYRLLRADVAGIFELYALGGLRSALHVTYEEDDVSFGNESAGGGLKRGFLDEAELLSNLDETIRPVEFGAIAGLSAEWRQFTVYARWDWTLGSFTRDIPYYGRDYRFRNTARMFTVTFGYSLVRL